MRIVTNMHKTEKCGIYRNALGARRGRRVSAPVFALFLALAAGIAVAAGGNNNPEDTTPPKPDDTPKTDVPVSDPVSVMTGAVFFDQTDVAVPCPGVPLLFVRDYRSNRDAGTNAPCP